MKGYLGEEIVDQTTIPEFATRGPAEWAVTFASLYGSIDGEHHKMWTIDQMVRILLGTPVIISIARWENHTSEYRFHTGEPSEAYRKWVAQQQGEIVEGEPEYPWDLGIAP
jgi:hypothetical protein